MLVEGRSDRSALEALACRRGRDLEAGGVLVVAMGGAKNIGRCLKEYEGCTVLGLCDAAEEGDFRRALERSGRRPNGTRDERERLGFYVCVADLEDEPIRALGPAAVEVVLETSGELAMFRTFQKQPAWRGRELRLQLRRFLATHSGRKTEIAPWLVDALEHSRAPAP